MNHSKDYNSANEWLMRQAAIGNMEAFSTIVNSNHSYVMSIAYQYLNNKEDAEDATQEVFIKLFKNAQKYKSQGKFYCYLSRITANECLNRLRSAKKLHTVTIEENIISHKDASPQELLSRKEFNEILHLAVAQLPYRQRAALLLKVHSQLSYEEISEVLQCPPSAVGALIFRARQTLYQNVFHHPKGMSYEL